jgi:glycosyltransferase involved in cell wall biosynthesis
MQKVLIISYFFTPCKLVGAERTDYWAKNLHNYGYFPIILTRQWNKDQIEITDYVISNQIDHEVKINYEIYRLPYKRTLRDILAKFEHLTLIRKSLTFLESFLSNFFMNALPYNNFYKKAESILENNPEISLIINSVAPFQALSITYQLKKKFPYKFFIADYRDEWTSRATHKPKNILEKVLFFLDTNSEKKWTSNLDFFITVSDTWRTSLQRQINKNGFVIKNGYDFKNFKTTNKLNNDKKLKIIYPGTLFPYQKIETFIGAVIKINKKFPESIQVDFYGVEVNQKELLRLKNLVKGHEEVFFIYNKINKIELAKKLSNSDIGLITNYENLKGCLPVKIFDYYYFGLTILLCPSDNDLMQQFLEDTQSGFVVNNEEECFNKLMELILLKKQAKLKRIHHQDEYFFQYSREHQTSLLANILNELTIRD